MSEARIAIWTIAGTVAVFKLVSSILIFAVFPSWYTFLLLIALSFLWFVPLFYICVVQMQRRYRLWNARMRRRQLLDQEWNVN